MVNYLKHFIKGKSKGMEMVQVAILIAIVVALGDDKSYILVATSKKNSAEVEVQLKKFGFAEMEIPEDFQGVPEDVIQGLTTQKETCDNRMKELESEKQNFAETHKDQLHHLLKNFIVGVQISEVEQKLESTELVYRITGWIPQTETENYMKELDNITEGRIAIRQYSPLEVPSVVSGKEQVPVKLSHGKFVKSFERMMEQKGIDKYKEIIESISYICIII